MLIDFGWIMNFKQWLKSLLSNNFLGSFCRLLKASSKRCWDSSFPKFDWEQKCTAFRRWMNLPGRPTSLQPLQFKKTIDPNWMIIIFWQRLERLPLKQLFVRICSWPKNIPKVVELTQSEFIKFYWEQKLVDFRL